MLFVSIFVITVGVLMIGQWAITIISRGVPKPEEDPVSGRGFFDMLFHWSAEFITAIMLIASGAGLLLETSWGNTVYLIATGMLIYTVINSPGFFAQQRKWPVVGMFIVILMLAVISLAIVIRG
ncbi:MAG: hypothetical protein JW954_05940 [Dehalococcoidaceae bacterium]|nr:hypothetical protein [Dehalococcoidaceae bacterium]